MRALTDYEPSRHDKVRTRDQCGLTSWSAFIESHLDPAIVRAVVEAEPKRRTDAARLAPVKKQVGRLGAQANTGRAWAWAR
jgi:hypothetical protein